jgi:beta-galactosidase GanA
MRTIWPKLTALHLNTVLVPVYWDLLEPREGVFDFTLVDGLLRDARQAHMRLVLLWFGSWKNSMSSYAPAWVKTNQARFPRAESPRGTGIEMLSPFSTANRDADARAFAALMRHLRTADRARTVVMVQVENEIGMIPTARDQSAPADSLYTARVPAELLASLRARRDSLTPELAALWAKQGHRAAGSWEEVFGAGPATEELFMAWHFARYTEHVTAAGKAEYPLPMYTNAALVRPGYAPGRYPSAGPLPHLFDVWRAAASSLDFLAPDVYSPNFVEWVTKYRRPGNPLFVPEANRAGDATAPANAFYVFGAHDAIGFSPFSIESIAQPATDPLAESYSKLAQLSSLILDHQGRGTIAGVRPAVSFTGEVQDSSKVVNLGDYTFTVSFRDPWASTQNIAHHGGLIIALAADEFLIAGTGLTITFAPRGPGAPTAGIVSAQEGKYVQGKWEGGRWLNGDETHQGRHVRIPAGQIGMQRVRLYRY